MLRISHGSVIRVCNVKIHQEKIAQSITAKM